MDDRASATGISNYLLALVVGVIMTWIMTRTIVDEILPRAQNDSSGNAVGTEAVTYTATFFEYWPLLVLFLGFFSLLALAIFQREILR